MVKNNQQNNKSLAPYLYGFALIILIFSNIAYAANITVTSSRNPVALDDSFHLIYEADSNVDDSPDFTPVYQYFDVLSSSQSTNMRSINGSWSLQKTWDLSVIAKDIGSITVPAISFGNDLSPAIKITVKNSSSPNSTSSSGQSTIPAEIFLESTVDKKQGWVQAQFIYTVRLLRTVNIASASISEPEISDPDAIIHKLSEDKYQTTRKGLRYEVFERRYAIFPQKSGRLKINPVTFEGRINTTQPRNIFDQFRMSGQLKRLRSKAVSINVKAAPASVNLQDWLPAKSIAIFEEWSDDIQNIKAGEPITRTISIVSQGLSAVQLPDINFDEIQNLKQYPDKAVTENKQDEKGITGLKQIKIALIPAIAGSYTLPKITLQWWNTKTNKSETAEIPAVNITATGVIKTQQIQPLAPSPQGEQSKVASIDKPIYINQSENQSYWKWLSLCLLAAWLITLALLLKKSKTKASNSSNSKPSFKNAASHVIKQVKKNDAIEAKAALIKWAKVFYSDDQLTNLSQITDYCSAQLKTEIRKLNHVLYHTGKENWQGKDLLVAFKSELSTVTKSTNTQASTLKPLYNK